MSTHERSSIYIQQWPPCSNRYKYFEMKILENRQNQQQNVENLNHYSAEILQISFCPKFEKQNTM